MLQKSPLPVHPQTKEQKYKKQSTTPKDTPANKQNQIPNPAPNSKRIPESQTYSPSKTKSYKEIERRRQNAEQERQAKRRAHDESTGEMQVEESGIVKLVHEARERGVQFEEDMVVDEGDFEGETEMATKKDVSRKTYNKEFKKVVEQADVVLYVFDARDPAGTRSKDIESMIRESPNGEKQLLLILNKIGNGPWDKS
jgi:nuclear GTP-binding protein